MTRTLRLPARHPHFIFFVSVLVFGLGLINVVAAQQSSAIVDAFEDYTADAREVIYLHLNKSTYIKGESVGFTAYVMDKKDKMPSLLTTNLYVSIEDMAQNPIKQQLLKVENGVASNVIDIDDNFSTGSYLVKAYTNWSRNFKEPNYFSATIKIIDPATDAYVDTERLETAIDAQFLPESGHLLADIVNKVGVVIKDTKGYGLANASGKVLNASGEVLTSFEVNHLGIGQFLLKPSVGDDFKVVITHNYKDFEFSLNQNIQPIGLVLSTAQRNNQLLLSINTNDKSLGYFKNQNFKLSFHNGSDLQVENIRFSDKASINRTYDMRQLPPGITVFTLFNDNNKPIAERLFFNYNGINIHKLSDVQTAVVENDSIDIALSFNTIDPSKFHNISVTVLPADTKSYKHHHNLISYNYLQPYIQGPIEEAKYYFTDIDAQKMAELDMLLLTQGWSSYNWNQIFNNKQSLPYDFEQGISLKANINGNKPETKTFMVHADKQAAPLFVELDGSKSYFEVDGLFLQEGESIAMSETNKRDQLRPAQLYLQSFPNRIPNFRLNHPLLPTKPEYNLKTSFDQNVMSTKTLDQLQELDEVVINAKVNDNWQRIKELRKTTMGQVFIPNQFDKDNLTLDQYLELRFNILKIETPFRTSFQYGPNGPSCNLCFVVNGERLSDIEAQSITNIPVDQFDYVALDRYRNIFEIFTKDGELSFNKSKPSVSSYELPLTFHIEKKFYTPVYRYRGDSFYKNFGTIAWEPRLQVNKYGKTQIKIQKPIVPITLFIEGLDHLGQTLFYEHTLTIN